LFHKEQEKKDGSCVTHAVSDETIHRIRKIEAKKAINSSGLTFNIPEGIKFQPLHSKQELVLSASMTWCFTHAVFGYAYLPKP